MKKLLVLALAVVMLVSVFALTACASEETYTGEVSYFAWGTNYGVKVNVTVKGDVITKVEIADSDYVSTSASWTEDANPGDLGHDKAEAAYAEWIAKTFVGKTVAEVNAYKTCITFGTNDDGTTSATIDIDTLKAEGYNLAGATQSAARIIYAVQNALSKIAA